MFRRHPPSPDAPLDAESEPGRLVGWFRRSAIYLSIVALLVLFVALLLVNRIVYNIHPGERGVRWSRFNGTVLDRDYYEGIRLIPPWDEMYIYNVRVQETHDTLVLLSSNGLPITISYSARYQPDLNKLPQLHQTYGPEYVEVMVKPEIASSLREVIGNYRPEEIYARDEMGLIQEMQSELESRLVNRFVTVQALLIKELRLTPELEQAINEKLVADQNAQAYEFRLRREESERLRKEIEARGIKSFEDISGISILKWRGIEATEDLARSPNSKIIVIGTGQNGLPVILNADSGTAAAAPPVHAVPATPATPAASAAR
jgi:regulator of protease activity HflC (stomatin/prohibitin superfamily)